MRRNVDLPPVTWECLSLLAHEMGYDSRQHLIEYILRKTVEQYPGLQIRVADFTAKKLAAKQSEMDWKKVMAFPKTTDADLKELLSDDDYKNMKR